MGEPKIFIDTTDLFDFARHNTTISGIQRVTLMVTSKIAQTKRRAYIIGHHPNKGRIVAYPADAWDNSSYSQRGFCQTFGLTRIHSKSTPRGNETLDEHVARRYGDALRGNFHRQRLRLINALQSGRAFKKRGIVSKSQSWGTSQAPKIAPAIEADARPGKGDIYFVPGAIWDFPEHLAKLNNYRQNGVTIIQFVHDLIPLVTPEHVGDGVPQKFEAWLRLMSETADRFIVNSDATKSDLETYLRARDKVSPINVVRLAQEFPGASRNDASYHPPKLGRELPTTTVRASVRNAARLPYALCVGTMETRKNIWTLARAWAILSQELGLSMPRLIFAGKRSAANEDFDDFMKASGHLGGLIRIVEKPTDDELRFLYCNSLFSVFVSYYEGWGLPIGESLWFGKTAVASHTSSMPEVGQNLVDYVDPYAPREIIDALRRMIVDEPHRLALEAAANAAVLRTWEDVCEDIVDVLVPSEPKREGKGQEHSIAAPL